MSKRNKFPVALTIAGSDSGGGAGIQADLNTFSALGVHGATAITCLTAQNPKRVLGVQAATPALVRQQLEAVFAEMPPAACKTGMLYSTAIIRTVADFFRRRKRPLLIVDPVMVATSGAKLIQDSALNALQTQLLPLAALVTPNLAEAQILAGFPITSEQQMRAAARRCLEKYGCPALIKGGHLPGARVAVDIFYDGHTELMLSAPWINGRRLHGTGCTYSAAIAGYAALGCDLPHAVPLAKQFITQAIAQARRAGRHYVLNWFWEN